MGYNLFYCLIYVLQAQALEALIKQDEETINGAYMHGVYWKKGCCCSLKCSIDSN